MSELEVLHHVESEPKRHQTQTQWIHPSNPLIRTYQTIERVRTAPKYGAGDGENEARGLVSHARFRSGLSCWLLPDT